MTAQEAAARFGKRSGLTGAFTVSRPRGATDEIGEPYMAVKKNGRIRRDFVAKSNGKELPLRTHAERALNDYFASLNGHRPAHLYDLVLREVEEPLFKAVLDYTEGNQVRAADILGINRGTLRKKLRLLGLSA